LSKILVDKIFRSNDKIPENKLKIRVDK